MPILTTPSLLDSPSTGYFILAPLSAVSQQRIADVQEQLDKQFPGLFWLPRGRQLHVTVLHLISQDREYNGDRDELFQSIKTRAVATLRTILPNPLRISVSFNSVTAYPQAIIVKGKDDGSFDRLRAQFVSSFALPEATRRPPDIIHSTIARYYQEHDFQEVETFVSSLHISFEETVDKLYLVHETRAFTQDHTILDTFPLQGTGYKAEL